VDPVRDPSKMTVVVLGPVGVGKSALSLQFTTQAFTSCHVPTIQDTFRKTIYVDDGPCIMDIVDTAGAEEYLVLEDEWIRMGDVFVLVFDVTDETSVYEVQDKFQKIMRCLDGLKQHTIPIIIVGNKMDLVPKGKTTPAIEKAKLCTENFKYWGDVENEVLFFQTSAKSGKNVDEVFHTAVKMHRGEEPEQPEMDENGMCIVS